MLPFDDGWCPRFQHWVFSGSAQGVVMKQSSQGRSRPRRPSFDDSRKGQSTSREQSGERQSRQSSGGESQRDDRSPGMGERSSSGSDRQSRTNVERDADVQRGAREMQRQSSRPDQSPGSDERSQRSGTRQDMEDEHEREQSKRPGGPAVMCDDEEGSAE